MPEVDEGLVPIKKERARLTGMYRMWECDQCGQFNPCRLIIVLGADEGLVIPKKCVVDDTNETKWQLVRITNKKG